MVNLKEEKTLVKTFMFQRISNVDEIDEKVNNWLAEQKNITIIDIKVNAVTVAAGLNNRPNKNYLYYTIVYR